MTTIGSPISALEADALRLKRSVCDSPSRSTDVMELKRSYNSLSRRYLDLKLAGKQEGTTIKLALSAIRKVIVQKEQQAKAVISPTPVRVDLDNTRTKAIRALEADARQLKGAAPRKELLDVKRQYNEIAKRFIALGLTGKPEGNSINEDLKAIRAHVLHRQSSGSIDPIKVPEEESQSKYPWKWIALGVLGVAIAVAAYKYGGPLLMGSDSPSPKGLPLPEDTTADTSQEQPKTAPEAPEEQPQAPVQGPEPQPRVGPFCTKGEKTGCYKPEKDPSIDCEATRSSLEEYQCSERPTRNPKICVFTSYTSDNPQRMSISHKVAENQRAYSQKHGYQYLEYPQNLAVDRGPDGEKEWLPYWSKIAGIRRILNDEEPSLKEKPEWIIWVDDDEVVTNSHVRYEDILLRNGGQNPDTHVIITEDTQSHIHEHMPFNSAIIMVRNSDWSREYFDRVWAMRKELAPNLSTTYGECPNQECTHEQQAMGDLLKAQPELAPHVAIIPQRDPETGMGINTSAREDHIDTNRVFKSPADGKYYYTFLEYSKDDRVETLWKTTADFNDFAGQATGLSTRGWSKSDIEASKAAGTPITDIIPRNLREEHINWMLQNAY